jgi:hypothetical protein
MRSAANMRAGVPFLVLFFTPVIGYIVMFVAPLLPRYLPSTLWTKQQILKFYRQDSAKRPYLLESFKEITSYTERIANNENNNALAESCSEFRKMIDRSLAGSPASNSELLSFAPAFSSGDMEIEKEDPHARRHLELALAYLNQSFILSKVMPFRALKEQSRRFINLITADDQLIKAEGGPSKLTVDELQSACHERGLPSEGLSHEQLVATLSDWVELTTSNPSAAQNAAIADGRLFPRPAKRHKALFPFPPALSCSSLPASLLIHAGALKFANKPE